jgi:hypothetical protein
MPLRRWPDVAIAEACKGKTAPLIDLEWRGPSQKAE